MKWLWRAADFLVGAVFIYAGVLKAMAPLRFASDIENYHLLPWAFGVRLAFYLPWLEMLCGLGLLTRRLYAGSIAILSALLAVFIAASVIARARGIDVSCGCFGTAGSNLGFAGHLAIDFGMLALLLLLGRKQIARS